MEWKFLTKNKNYELQKKEWNWLEDNVVIKSNGFTSHVYYSNDYYHDSFFDFLKCNLDREIHIIKIKFYLDFNRTLIVDSKFFPHTSNKNSWLSEFADLSNTPIDITSVLI